MMTEKNLIKFTSNFDNTITHLIVKLPKKVGVTQQEYRNCFFEINKRELNYLADLFNKEIKELIEDVNLKNLPPSEKWHAHSESIKAQTLLQAYFIFLRTYIENIINFITLYLQDLENRGVLVGKVGKGNKDRYENLKRLDVEQGNLDMVMRVRNAKVHGNSMQYSLAFEKIDNKHEVALVGVEYKDLKPPYEKDILYYKDMEIAFNTVKSIIPLFSSYVDNLLKDSKR